MEGNASASSAAFIPVSSQKAWLGGEGGGSGGRGLRLPVLPLGWAGCCAVWLKWGRKGQLPRSPLGINGSPSAQGSDYSSLSLFPRAPRLVIVCPLHSSVPHTHTLITQSLSPLSLSPSLSSSLIPSIPHSLPHSLTMQAHSSFYSPEPPKGWILNRCTIQVHYGIN